MPAQPDQKNHDLGEPLSASGALPRFMREGEVADLLRVSPRKLERDRHRGVGIPFLKIGRRVLYRQQDVMTYAATHVFVSTADARRGR